MSDRRDRVRDQLTDLTRAVLPAAAPGKRTKGKAGRPKKYIVPRVKVSFYLTRATWRELRRIQREDQAKRGPDEEQISLTAMAEKALAEYIRRRQSGERTS